MNNKMAKIQLVISLLVSISLIFMTYQYTKLKETSEKEYARLSSVTYQSLKKLDEKILDDFLILEKNGLSSEDVSQINSKILNQTYDVKNGLDCKNGTIWNQRYGRCE